MSKKRFARISIDAAADDRLTKSDYRVLIVIAAHANDRLECWPSQEVIKGVLGWKHNSQVSNAVKRLVKFGWLIKETRKAKKGHFGNNKYRIVLESPLFGQKTTVSSDSETVVKKPSPSSPHNETDSSPVNEMTSSLPSETNRENKHKKKTDWPCAGARLRGPAPVQVFPILTHELQSLGLSAIDAGHCLQDIASDTYSEIERGLQSGSMTSKQAALIAMEASYGEMALQH